MKEASKVRNAMARAIHAHQLCCGLALEYCPARRDLILEAALVMQDLESPRVSRGPEEGRMKRSPILRCSELRSRRRKSDVPDWLPGYLMARDQVCVPHKRLGAPGECFGRLTIEHVRDRDKPATGMKAPSDKWHTLIACLGANTGWCLTSAAKELEREYLERVEGFGDDAA